MLAVELSSQQLHFAPSIRPAAGALLNLAADHLDWHGSFEAYAMAKSAVWFGAVAIGNADDPLVAQLLADRAWGARRVHAGRTGRGPARRRERAPRVARVRRCRRSCSPRSRTSVRPVCTTSRMRWPPRRWRAAFGVGAEAIAAGLAAFVPDPHRNQTVRSAGGITWVDDSKATNAHAALRLAARLRTGGVDRGRPAQGRRGRRAGRAGRAAAGRGRPARRGSRRASPRRCGDTRRMSP